MNSFSKLIFFIGLILGSQYSYSQIKISSNGSSFVPDPSSILEVEATNKGLLLPRVNALSNIQAPAVGLIVFLTTESKLYNYTNSGWKPLVSVDTLSLSNRINAKLNLRNGTAYNLIIADSLKVNGIYIGRGRNNTTGSQNFAMGTLSLNSNRTGNYNLGIGFESLTNLGNNPGGEGEILFPIEYQNFNTAIGYKSARSIQRGIGNLSIGSNALLSLRYGNYNIALGDSAGYNQAIGNYNIFIGSKTVNPNILLTMDNSLVIANSIFGRNIYDINAANFGIRTNNPQAALHVNGGILANSVDVTGVVRIRSGNPGEGKVLMSDGAGNTRWSPMIDTTSLSNRINRNLNQINTNSNQINSKLNARNGTAFNLKVVDSLKVNGIYFGSRQADSTNNHAIGFQALYSNTDGSNNTVYGVRGLFSNLDGSANTAVGFEALYKNISGRDNTAYGYYSLWSNNYGIYNTALGSRSLNDNTTGSFNTAFGSQALRINSIGRNNTASGYQALYWNTIGSNNTANGYQALFYNTGSYNTAIGHQALQSNTSGQYNTANGSLALHSNINGDYNIANGYKALQSNTGGQSNTAIGYLSLGNNSTGNNNLGFGSNSGRNLTTGSNNIAIGNSSDFISSTDSYQLNIGNEIYGKNVGEAPVNPVQIAIGTTSFNGSNMLTVSGSVAATGFSTSSDRRFKKNIKGINLGLKEVLQLKPSSYYWNPNNKRMTHADSTKLQYGFIAQDLELVIPAIVSGDGSEKDYKSVNYEALIPVLTKAIQEQQVMMEKQQEMIEALKKRIEILEKREEN